MSDRRQQNLTYRIGVDKYKIPPEDLRLVDVKPEDALIPIHYGIMVGVPKHKWLFRADADGNFRIHYNDIKGPAPIIVEPGAKNAMLRLTHNDTLFVDGDIEYTGRITTGAVESMVETLPEEDLTPGDRYILLEDDYIYEYNYEDKIGPDTEKIWHVIIPRIGQQAWIIDESKEVTWNGSYWDASSPAAGGNYHIQYNSGGLLSASPNFRVGYVDPETGPELNVYLNPSSFSPVAGDRLIWRGSNGAFRAGTNLWNLSDLAEASVGFGIMNKATAVGSFSHGISSESTGNFSFTMGVGLKAESLASFVVGRFNEGGGAPDEWHLHDPIFEVGIGDDNDNRRNAMTIFKDGYTTFYSGLYTEEIISPRVRGECGDFTRLNTDSSLTASAAHIDFGYAARAIGMVHGVDYYYTNNNMTLLLDIKIDSLDIDNRTIYHYISNDEHGSYEVRIGIQNNNLYFGTVLDWGSEVEVFFIDLDGDTDFVLGQWNTIGFTIDDAGNAKVFIDDDTFESPSPLLGFETPREWMDINFGAFWHEEVLEGELAEIAIWDSIISDEDILSYIYGGLPVSDEFHDNIPLLYFNFHPDFIPDHEPWHQDTRIYSAGVEHAVLNIMHDAEIYDSDGPHNGYASFFVTSDSYDGHAHFYVPINVYGDMIFHNPVDMLALTHSYEGHPENYKQVFVNMDNGHLYTVD